MLIAPVLALLLASATVNPHVVTIYVGPYVREGFVDVDKGIRDSIADIQQELRKNDTFRVVTVPESAELKLLVVRRGYGDAAGGVGVPVGALTIYVPQRSRFVETVLRVGSYERAFVGEDYKYERWGKCAQMIAKDVSVWLAANRQAQSTSAQPTPATSVSTTQSGRLRVLTDPVGAEIYVGDLRTGITTPAGLLIELPAGSVTISARKAGYSSVDRTLAVGGSEEVVLPLTLRPSSER
jgi:hypothetical protein